ncbi:MAG: dihydrodipicolinate synthase family protein [candidate division Zixibacteria bacterium]|nr:dihydrodipicolinate synthase family protein [candidate division Zixibacteria bacterium]
MQFPLKGIIPPVITPLNNYYELDVEGLHNLVEHLISGKVHGLFLLGTNGEAPSLSYKLRKDFIKLTCDLVNHRVPVLVGISDTSFAGSLDISEYSKACGADAVVVAPPYYFPVAEEELINYFEALTTRLDLPFLLYNMPSHTKVSLSIETVKRVKEMGAIGIKDSSGDMFFLYSLIEEFIDSPDFSIFTGTELFLPETIRYGGHGAVAGGANIFPELFVKLYEASINNDSETIARLRKKVIMLYDTIYKVGRFTSRITKGIKCSLSVMGVCSDYMAPPFCNFNSTERKEIEEHLKDISKVN